MRSFIVFALTALAAAPLSAQRPAPSDSTRVYAQRAELDSLVDFYDRSAESPAYSEALRQRARTEAQELRDRLESGDFQVGDRVLLDVRGEEALSDTFTVAAGQVLELPEIGAVPLKGVLRAELQDTLTAQLSRYVREPRVIARSLVQISITGAVARPGFFTVPSETLLSAAINLAGVSPGARLDELTVQRGGRTILSSTALEAAIRVGRTLDQLGLVGGDRIIVPERGAGLGGPESAVRTVSYLLSIPLTIYAVTQIF